MTALLRLLALVARDLDALGAPWALVGGLAVGVRVRPRFTQDIDLAVAVGSDREAERLVAELRRRGYALDSVVEQEAVARLSIARLLPAGEGMRGLLVDLLFAACGFESEIATGAERLEVARDLTLPVARSGHLVAMKLLASDPERRPADLDDLLVLFAAVDAADLALAREAVRLAAARGYARGRDLEADLDRWIARAARP